MEKLIKFSTVFILVLFFSSCSSDSSDDGCTPITCLNGGISNSNCGCDCPQGFTGSNCSTQMAPAKILISQIKVKNFPNKKPDGITTWDSFPLTPSFNNPDIFPFLTLGSISLFQGAAFQDVISNGNGTDNFTWIPSTPIQIVAINSQFTLVLYDEDAGIPGYEIMGGFNFNLYNSTGGFPTTLVLSNPSSPYRFELTLSYVW